MYFSFNEGDTFIDGIEWIIVNIDYEDDEYPYECYPVEIFEKTKAIVKDQYDTVDEELEWGDIVSVIDDYFIDERQCYSDSEIQVFVYETKIKKLKDENEKLKAEIEKLKGGM